MATRKKTKTPSDTAPRALAKPKAGDVRRDFDVRRMDRSTIAIPLLEDIDRQKGAAGRATRRPAPHAVIIDVHLEYPEGRDAARARVEALVAEIAADKRVAWGLARRPQGLDAVRSRQSRQYLFGHLDGRFIEELVGRDRARVDGQRPAIYRIWPDFELKPLLHKSIGTVKADAAQLAFRTTGEGIVWAVLDSGIDEAHEHFKTHASLTLDAPLAHRDYVTDGTRPPQPLVDRYGHGTHVAGIIAGELTDTTHAISAVGFVRDQGGKVIPAFASPPRIAGMAPRCKLLSMKVLDDKGRGRASSVIMAIEQIQEWNGYGRYPRVHGVNLSAGYNFEPEWFACGQSPLCVEVDRLVKSGVVVVVAAGNTGYGTAQSAAKGAVPAGLGLTINDPGNADLAITVGSTHRDMPHVYGVSYFSSKGPTGDGRPKPDLVAPGEKIISCTSADRPQVSSVPAPTGVPARPRALYHEDSGTSMAAPHVSGVIAAFLSVRREFIFRPDRVKQLFVSTATDLKRDRYFQGSGLVDLMRAIQSV